MRIIKELPKNRTTRMSIEKRIKEIKDFENSGANYGLLEFRACKKAYSDTQLYKKAYDVYIRRGGEGLFSFKTLDGGCYIINEGAV